MWICLPNRRVAWHLGLPSDVIVTRVTLALKITGLCFANVRTWRSADEKAWDFAAVR